MVSQGGVLSENVWRYPKNGWLMENLVGDLQDPKMEVR